MLRYELKAAFSDTYKNSIRSNSLVTAILDISENSHIFKKAHGNMNIKHQLPMRSFFFRFAIDKDISCGSEKRRGKGGRSGAAERENDLLALNKKERRAVRVLDLVSQISRRQSAGDCSNILKHAVFKWLRFSWRLWSRKDRVKDVKNHGCFCETKYSVSAGTDKRLPYARTESVIGLCFLLLTHA